MKNKLLYVLSLIILIGIGTVLFYGRLHSEKWNGNKRFLEGAIQTGITMQLTIDEFYRLTGRYPKYDEFTNIIPLICSTTESVTPHATGSVVALFSNNDGWFYDTISNQIRVNYIGKYFVDSQSWVDLSKIRFRSPTKVELMSDGESKSLDYSHLNEHASGYVPQIDDIIKNWANTNKLNELNKPAIAPTVPKEFKR